MTNPFQNKIFRAEQWTEAILFLEGKDIVFTNGCFDLLHPGHLIYLSQAASLSANLVIGLNSDESVRELKGPDRPINNFIDRANMLSALQQVSCVVEFKEATPLKLIEMVKPKILVKGGDYNVEEIVGREFVESNGGRVETIPFVGNYSSSSLIEKIKKA